MNLTLIGSFLFAILLLAVLFFFFERRKPQLSTILMIATLCAIGSVGRMIFNFIPQVQPVTAIVIIAGVCLGGQSGFMVGALSAFVSNMVLGQGPWTPWQMLAWGLIGLLSGLIGHIRQKKSLQLVCAVSFFAAFVFSFTMDVYTVASIGAQLTLPMAVTVFGTGFLFNISHAVGNVVFILLLYLPLERKLARISDKYQN